MTDRYPSLYLVCQVSSYPQLHYESKELAKAGHQWKHISSAPDEIKPFILTPFVQ